MIINISSVEERTAANGRKFWTVKADTGTSWNVFDPKFKTLAGTTVEVSTTQNGKFTNIELVRTGVQPEPRAPIMGAPPAAGYNGSVSTYSTFKRDVEKVKGTSMSYAKDVVIAYINKGIAEDPAIAVKSLDFFYRFFKDTLMENDEELMEDAPLEG